MVRSVEGQGPGLCMPRWIFPAGLVLATGGFVLVMYWLKERGVAAGVLTGLLFGYMGLVGGIVALVGRWLRDKGVVAPMRAPVRRYLWRFMPAMGLYVIVLFVSLRLYRNYDLAEPLIWLVAVAPGLFGCQHVRSRVVAVAAWAARWTSSNMRQGADTLRQTGPLRHFLQQPFSSGWCWSTNTRSAATNRGTSCLAIDNADAPSPSEAIRDTRSKCSTSRRRSSENKTRLPMAARPSAANWLGGGSVQPAAAARLSSMSCR